MVLFNMEPISVGMWVVHIRLFIGALQKIAIFTIQLCLHQSA